MFDGDSDELTRRSMVKRLGTVGAASAAISGVSTAREPSAVRSVDAARAELTANTGSVLETLADHGVIDDPRPETLDLTGRTPDELGGDTAGLAVVRADDGEYAVAAQPHADGELRVYQNLADGTAHAVLDTGDATTLYTENGRAHDVNTLAGCGSACAFFECGPGRNYRLDLVFAPNVGCVPYRDGCGC